MYARNQSSGELLGVRIGPSNYRKQQKRTRDKQFREGLFIKQKRGSQSIFDTPNVVIILCSYPLKRVTCTLYSTGASDMPCDPNLVSSAFYTIPIFPLPKLQFFYL